MRNNNVYLKEIEYPVFGEAAPVLYPSPAEMQERIHNAACWWRKEGLHIW